MSFLGEIISGFNPASHDEAEMHYRAVYSEGRHHEGSFTHEAIAGAAGFAAMKAYESHLRATGQQPSHLLMKEMLAGIAAAEVDKLVETKGLDWVDAHKAKKMARQQAHHLAEQRYGHGNSGYDYAMSQNGPAFEYIYGGGSPYGLQGCPSYGYAYGGGPMGYGGGGYAPPPPQGYYPPQQQGYAPQYYQQPPPQQYYGGQQGGYGGQGGYEGQQGGYGGQQGGYY
ncbi:hypothetical protein JAAARDRAFT_200399 [Jaapia argillacea MUCL 33604]|uniref:CipC-like antibiotic response protein n=1 Tax=Jaapia argillacea MUCL 33604 TaxID=933084 RepID=A0A067PG53_9AGAM|nr:hypothetical protein JAAARDRAFT_200399 [Jaapia argillacea MUCL 33604]